MVQERKKYNCVLDILRKSKPVLDSTEGIEKEVIKRITIAEKSKFNLSDITDFLFGWTYIGWIRRSLITASILLVMIFVYQQGIIIKQVNFLSRQITIMEGETAPSVDNEIGKQIVMYKMSGRRLPSKYITISEKQMKQLMESINELEVKYKDLQNLIEENPELKRYIEEKMKGKNRININL
jgi:hypothetical protein